MPDDEPADEFSEMIERIWAILKAQARRFLPRATHTDLKRTYGHECASVMLREVRHPDHYFALSDGVVLRGLCDLEDALREMDSTTFQKHVAPHKNEFAVWVGDIVGDGTLADKLQLLDAQSDMARAVSVRVNWLKSRVPLRH